MTTLTSETVFLLTTFSNMTRSRVWKEEKGFIQAVALHLFEVNGEYTHMHMLTHTYNSHCTHKPTIPTHTHVYSNRKTM